LATAHQIVEQERKVLDDKARPSRALEDLVDARILSGDYASRLGVVALARHDFEKVSDLIRAVNASIEGPSPGDEAEVKVNRIVLYIDDLDRCEPENVAKVLQAVHLLLAFPLFVVVVGVDPRWVGRALKKQYPDLLDYERGDLWGSGSGPKGVSPNDYLEKIFQIPFWLQPLNDDRTKSMLRGLTGVGVGPDRRRPVRRDGSGTPDGTVTPSDTDSAGRSEGPSPTGPTGSGRLAQSQELNPRGLLLESHEVDAMQELSHLLGRSPRALKRFVNVYRLFKVRQPDVVDFADQDRPDADYRVVLYLLAEIIGRPAAAADLFDFIRTADDETVLTMVPPGWPQHAGAYQAWLDEVGRFSFRAMTVDEER
jgi:hypothetical protein